ncbi:MAG: helix-turn-helix domain-containing protein, partial [Pelosinus sp.]|nr:helix-turn-helix domain-containing protein [Pelosinus sp.]
MPNIYGKYLKDFRVKQGIKAAFVARRIHVSPATYSQIESGERGLSAERLDGILRAIGLHRNELDIIMHSQAANGKGSDQKGKRMVAQ